MRNQVKRFLDWTGDYFEEHFGVLYALIAIAAIALGIVMYAGVNGYLQSRKTAQDVREIRTIVTTSKLTSDKTILASRELACQNARVSNAILIFLEKNPKLKAAIPTNADRAALKEAVKNYIPKCFDLTPGPNSAVDENGNAIGPTTPKDSKTSNPRNRGTKSGGPGGNTPKPTKPGPTVTKPNPTVTNPQPTQPNPVTPTPQNPGPTVPTPVNPDPVPPVDPTPVVPIPPVVLPPVDICANLPGIQTSSDIGVNITIGIGGICIKI